MTQSRLQPVMPVPLTPSALVGLVLMLALLWQAFAVQAHVHLGPRAGAGPALASGPALAAADAPALAQAKAQTGAVVAQALPAPSEACLICRLQALTGHVLLPAMAAVVAVLAQVLAPALANLRCLRVGAGRHPWRSRAPPEMVQN